MTDYTAYKNLYLLCFTDDTDEDAELLFKNVLSKAKLIAEYSAEGNPIAMLFLMDTHIIQNNKKLPFYYLYAACTHPDYRGQGIMGKLLEKSKETATADNKFGIFLKPANKSLFNFYAKSDFSPFFNVCKISTSAKEFKSIHLPFSRNTNQTTMFVWQEHRKLFLNGYDIDYVDFCSDMLCTAADGSTTIESDNFGFVYELRDNTLLIKEALCSKGFAMQLLSAIADIAKSVPCKEIEIRLPALLADELKQIGVSTEPFSVMWLSKHNNEKYNTETAYHGFAFD